jgi:ketosteroid isomerase-like protein
MSSPRRLPTDEASAADARAVVERFRTGWEKRDADQILSTIARRDDFVMYGTDLVERWIGYASLIEPTRAMVRAFEDPVYTWGEGEPRVWVRGSVGWVCGDLTVRTRIAGQPLTSTMRSTFVLVREVDGWKIAHAHFSIGQEQPVADYG